jgi:hypothetical protein
MTMHIIDVIASNKAPSHTTGLGTDANDMQPVRF